MTDLKITLIRSATHHLPNRRRIVKALGLDRINSSIILPDNVATRGALIRTAYLISVEEVNK